MYPLVAVIREIRRIYPKKNLEFYYLGPKDEFGLILLAQEGLIIKTIISGKLRRYFSLQNFIDILFKIPFGAAQSFFQLLIIKPDLIFSKGGSGSIAVTQIARILRIPVFFQESDVVPGLSNQHTSKWAKKVFVSFPFSQSEYFPEKKMIYVGNPIRRELLRGSKEGAKELFNLTGEKPVILIMGGSQGAEIINDTILAVLPQILAEFELIYQTGEKNFKEVKAEAKVVISKDLERYFHPAGFLKEIELREAYAAADLILSRAGSGTIFEIAALGKPSILIPLASAAQDHQVKNAYTYAAGGAALVIEEVNLTPHFLLEKLRHLFSHREELQKMSEKALAFSRPDSDRIIAEYILDYFKK